MQKHIDLLGILYQIWGGLNLLLAASLLVLALGAVTTIPTSGAAGAELAAGVTALTFATIAAVLFAWGISHVLNGRGLKRRRAWARPVALALAALNIFFLPFGTAVGIYGLWVLIHQHAKNYFTT